jgi:hypothetical protein
MRPILAFLTRFLALKLLLKAPTCLREINQNLTCVFLSYIYFVFARFIRVVVPFDTYYRGKFQITNLTFRGPCIVIYVYSYNKTNEMH